MHIYLFLQSVAAAQTMNNEPNVGDVESGWLLGLR